MPGVVNVWCVNAGRRPPSEGRDLTQNRVGKGREGAGIQNMEQVQEEGRTFKVEVQHAPSTCVLSLECRFPSTPPPIQAVQGRKGPETGRKL